MSSPRYPEAPAESSFEALTNGLTEILPSYQSALRVSEDVTRFHLAGFDCLCLRCGARFNEDVE